MLQIFKFQEIDPNKPYYSVLADSLINFPVHGTPTGWYFQNWCSPDDGADIQDASALQTAVVFQSSGDDLIANNKGHLAFVTACAPVITTAGELPINTTANYRIQLEKSADFTHEIIPKQYSLEQNYPNPFNPLTYISFSLPKAGDVRLAVYDVKGQKVKELINGYRPAGQHQYIFNGEGLSSGLYFYRIEAGSFSAVKRMLLIK